MLRDQKVVAPNGKLWEYTRGIFYIEITGHVLRSNGDIIARVFGEQKCRCETCHTRSVVVTVVSV